jgi:hypothetical protein
MNTHTPTHTQNTQKTVSHTKHTHTQNTHTFVLSMEEGEC